VHAISAATGSAGGLVSSATASAVAIGVSGVLPELPMPGAADSAPAGPVILPSHPSSHVVAASAQISVTALGSIEHLKFSSNAGRYLRATHP
jgi:hypothetical protein